MSQPLIRRQSHLPHSGPFSHRALYILINDTIAWMVMLALHYIWRLCGKVCVCIWSRSCHFPLKSRQKPPLDRSGETLLSLVEVTFILKHRIQFLVLFERFSSFWWLRSNARHLELKEMSKKTHKIKAISFILKGWWSSALHVWLECIHPRAVPYEMYKFASFSMSSLNISSLWPNSI